MRWTSPVSAGLTGLVVGILAGYSLPRGGEMPLPGATSSTAAKAPADAHRTKDGSPAQRTAAAVPFTPPGGPRSSSPDSLLRSIPASDDRPARDAWVQNLPPGEIPSLVAALCADIGPGGLEDEDQRLIDDALRNWWKTDSGAVIAWLKQLPNNGTKRYLVSSLLQDLAYTDPARAAALAESFKAQDPGWNDSKLQDRLVKREVEEAWKRPNATAEEMLELYSRFSRGSSTMGERISVYPAGFDFRKFLNGLAALNSQHGKSLAEMPSDTLKEWAKIDPQAAVQWLLESRTNEHPWGPLSFADWESIADGVAASRGPQAYHQWAAGILAQPDQGDLRDLILRESKSADLVGIIGQIANTAQRDAALAAAVSSDGWQRQDDIELLGMISTPEARLQVLLDSAHRFTSWIERGQRDPSFWPRAGLTTEQVSTVVSIQPNR